jgi:hypothetical protein
VAVRAAVVGPLTRDVVVLGCQGVRQVKPGGVAYYGAYAMQRAGAEVTSFARLAPADAGLLTDLPFALRPVWAATTTVFTNAYPREDTDYREQSVDAVCEPFGLEDVRGVQGFDVVLLGPLMGTDLPAVVVEWLADHNGLLGLDVQGYLRRTEGARVIPARWEGCARVLARVDVLKCNAAEAEAMVGLGTPAAMAAALAALGPREVLVTLGSRGSWVHAEGCGTSIAATEVPVADPTGAGDTYVAGYLVRRLEGATPADSGRFAAELAGRRISGAL